MNSLAYRVRFEEAEEGGYVVTFPDFGWGVTEGDTYEEAIAEAKDVLGTILARMMADGKTVPTSGRVEVGDVLVAPPAEIAAKVLLYWQFQGERK